MTSANYFLPPKPIQRRKAPYTDVLNYMIQHYERGTVIITNYIMADATNVTKILSIQHYD